MGQLLVAGAKAHPGLSLAAAPERSLSDVDVRQSLAGCRVVIDFSLPDGTERLLKLVTTQALVIGTTGLSEATAAALSAHAAHAAVLQASNFSTGITLLLELASRAAAALPDYDLEIVEMHHRHKRDAPSGTARSLAEAAAEARQVSLAERAVYGREGEVGPRPSGEIGIHALRGGDIYGEHTVTLAGPGERLTLGHMATSRQAFAEGALQAAAWIAERPSGWYAMRDVIGL